MRRVAVLIALVGGLWVLPSSASAATCDGYGSQAAAQRAADTTDADGDGIYCESLPCPCLRGGGPSGGSPGTAPGPRPAPKPRRTARVYRGARITSVVDGDTLKVRLANGVYRTVRLLGVDTPETHRLGVPVECGGRRAFASLLRLTFTAPVDRDGDGLEDDEGGTGRGVTLRTDPTQATTDRYGRLLAYATTLAGRNLAVDQLAAGWATVYVYDNRPFTQVARFRQARTRARTSGRGVWATCAGNFHVAARSGSFVG